VLHCSCDEILGVNQVGLSFNLGSEIYFLKGGYGHPLPDVAHCTAFPSGCAISYQLHMLLVTGWARDFSLGVGSVVSCLAGYLVLNSYPDVDAADMPCQVLDFLLIVTIRN